MTTPVDIQRELRADLVIALEKSRFVAWLRASDPNRVIATNRTPDDCALRTYLWEVLAAARYPLDTVLVYMDHVEVYTDVEGARSSVPYWCNRFLHKLLTDVRVPRYRITVADVRRVMGV